MKTSLKVLFLITVFSPMVVSAATVSLKCPETVKVDEDVVCDIIVESDELVAGVETSISTSNGLTFKKYVKGEGWSGDSSEEKFLVYGNKVSGEENVLGTYTYTVDSSAGENLTVSLYDIVVSNEDGEPLDFNETFNATIKVKVDNEDNENNEETPNPGDNEDLEESPSTGDMNIIVAILVLMGIIAMAVISIKKLKGIKVEK